MPNRIFAISQDGGVTAGEYRLRLVLKRGMAVALVAHALFLAIFAAVGAGWMADFNVASVAVYAGCLALIRRGHYTTPLALATIEVVLHAWLAVSAVGHASGFQYYVFVLAPVAFIHPRWPLPFKVLYISGAGLAYVLLDDWARQHAAQLLLGSGTLTLLHAVNTFGSFGMLAYIVYYYSEAVAEVEVELEHQAGTDPLTGMWNRRRLQEAAERELASHRRADRAMALVICDLDDFKQVNDRLGHDCGDAVLQQTATRLRQALRAQDYVARWGGEEFLMLLPETTEQGAVEVAEKLRAAVASAPFRCADQELPLTITAGLSALRSEDSLERAIARADEALLAGKRAGKNRVVTAE